MRTEYSKHEYTGPGRPLLRDDIVRCDSSVPIAAGPKASSAGPAERRQLQTGSGATGAYTGGDRWE